MAKHVAKITAKTNRAEREARRSGAVRHPGRHAARKAA